MNKTLFMSVAAMLATASANAETVSEVADIQPSESQVSDFDLNTDVGMLEAKAPLMKAPAATDKKDANYYATALGSRLKVTGYAQAGYSANFLEDGGPNSNSFDVKRAILMVGAEVTPKFYAFFMHSFKNNSMQEYWLEYRASKAFNIRLGQYKIPFTIENPLSPTVLESVTCPAQGVAFYIGNNGLIGDGSGRDQGIMATGELFDGHFKYSAAVMNGGKINTSDKNNQKDVMLKLEYMPSSQLKLAVSGVKGYGYRYDGMTSPYTYDIAVGETYRSDKYSVGFEYYSEPTKSDYYRNRSVYVRSEMMGGRDKDNHSFGAYISSAIPVSKTTDIVAMVDYFNYNTDAKLKATKLMAGVQYWLFKKCRLQLQYQYTMNSDDMKAVNGPNAHSIQSQVQVAF